MSRIRSIKPDFFKDEKVSDLDPETRLLFIGLWTLADRKGILEDRPRWIRAELFPYNSDFDIDTALLALAHAGMCVRYKADDGALLIHITNFAEHQRPNSREPASNRPFPPPMALKPLACADARNDMSTHAHAQEEREGKGNEKYSCAQKMCASELFEKFWGAYPKKKSKGNAEKAFKSIKPKPDEQLVATMIATIERAKTSVEWTKDGGQFIPYPATWLRAQGWEDQSVIDLKLATTKPRVCRCGKTGDIRDETGDWRCWDHYYGNQTNRGGIA